MYRNLSSLIFVISILSTIAAPLHASGTGPGDEDAVASWDYCMQESIKANVWGAEKTAKAAVAAAYVACRADFKSALHSLHTAKQKAALKQRAENDFKMHVDFAVKMKKLGNPNP